MHIKYKARSWDDIYGQDHIKKFLDNYDLAGKSILLEGKPGTGKTRIAEIVASDFASHPENIIYRNCSDLGKQDVKDLFKELPRSSIFGKNKVLILDEPQELPHAARQNTLTPLENLSKNVLLIACSAFPEKIAKAGKREGENYEGQMVLDRFIRLKTKPLDKTTSINFLNSILKKEGLDIPKPFKALIVKKCEGIPRKILHAIPKIASASSEEEVEFLLDVGNIDEPADVLELFKILKSGRASWETVRTKLKTLLMDNDPAAIKIALMSIMAGSILSPYYDAKSDKGLLSEVLRSMSEISSGVDRTDLIAAINLAYFKLKGE